MEADLFLSVIRTLLRCRSRKEPKLDASLSLLTLPKNVAASYSTS
jgi:hypothetical protein